MGFQFLNTHLPWAMKALGYKKHILNAVIASFRRNGFYTFELGIGE